MDSLILYLGDQMATTCIVFAYFNRPRYQVRTYQNLDIIHSACYFLFFMCGSMKENQERVFIGKVSWHNMFKGILHFYQRKKFKKI